jgi:hypothetical protein
MNKNAPPPPDILRKSGPHKDRTKYDRKRTKDEDHQREPGREDRKNPTGK